MYVFFLVWKALFLQLLPSVAAISNPTSITRAIGEDVVFTFNASTYIKDVIWGLRDGESSNLKLPLMSGLLSIGVKLNPNMPEHYAGRVSFVGNLTKGEAWFKITNLNMNDTNEYMAKLLVKDATNYENIPMKLIVILPVPISSPGSLTRKVGQNALFMMNGTAMSEATWGVRDGNTNDLNPRLIRVFNPGGAFQDSKLNSTSYAGRVSFVGDLTRGQAWFKIINLNINDTNQYMAQILIGASNYENIPIKLTVLQPAPTTSATKTPQTSTTNTIVPNSSSFHPPTTVLSEPTSSFPGNQSRNCECTCTTIIATCLTFIVLLTVVITFLLFFLWKGKTKAVPKEHEV